MARSSVVVRCPLPACGKLTGWRYPNFQWARTHVPGVPPRVFLHDDGHGVRGYGPDERCPDPFGHVNQFRRQRYPGASELKPEGRYTVDPDPVDDPNEDEPEPDPWVSPDMPPGARWD